MTTKAQVCSALIAAMVSALMMSAAWAVPLPPSGLQALHRDGQTFLTWNEVSGTGVRYRIYHSGAQILSTGSADSLGSVDQKSTRDARGQQAEGGGVKYFAILPNTPLSDNQGLFVVTVPDAAARYYAVTSYDSTGENTTLTLGANSLLLPVNESPMVPRPVLQRTVTAGSNTVEVYVHWVWHEDTPAYPAMSNLPSVAFHFGLVRRGMPPHPLLFRPHARGGSYMAVVGGTGTANEWTLALDDELVDTTRNTFWFGYHEGLVRTYGILPPAPIGGQVIDYTVRRLDWTLDWAWTQLPIDTNRVFMYGGSMGAIGSVFYALHRPDRIAAIFGTVPKFDFSFLNDPNPAHVYNPGMPERLVADRLWGTVGDNLPTPNGMGVYDRLNAGQMAVRLAGTDLPPLLMFNGKNDVVVGWAEKIHTYAEYDSARQCAVFFFDQRPHGGGFANWLPMQNTAQWLYRFRRDQSFPALSNCSANHDPGDGHATSGDSIGAINAFVTWAVPVEAPAAWQVDLTRQNLTAQTHTVFAPESVYVDVTPRRLQSFAIVPGQPYAWENRRLADNGLVQSGTILPDSLALLTVPQFLVSGSGSRLIISSGAGLDPDAPPIYVTVISHNEEPPGNPDYAASPEVYLQHRTGVVNLANMLREAGVKYNWQSDWNFLLAMQLYDTGSASTNGKNLARWLSEDLHFECDPHAHESSYNYADVAYLMNANGVPPSPVVGGFLALPVEQSKTEYFRDTLAGAHYDYRWKAEVLWGGAWPNHPPQEDTIKISGIWKPRSDEDFLGHDQGAPLPHIGGYLPNFEGLEQQLALAQNGTYVPGRIYTQTIMLRQPLLTSEAYIDSIRDRILSLQSYTDLGLIRWVGLGELMEIWRSEFDSAPSLYSYLAQDYLVGTPQGLTCYRTSTTEVTLRWTAVAEAGVYYVYGNSVPDSVGAVLLGTTTETQFAIPYASERQFFFVKSGVE